MRILEKYVVKGFLSAFFFCITLLMVLGIIGDVLGFLDDILKNGISLVSILSFYFYLAPFAFVNMVPFAALLSAVYVFNSLSKNHEVTAVITSGLSLWKLLRPILLSTFIICLFTLIINERFVPTAMGKANRIRNEELEREGEKKGARIRNLTVYAKGNQIIFAKSYNRHTDVMEDVIIHRQDKDHRVIEKINSRLVKWQGNGIWQGVDVLIFKISPDGTFSKDPENYKRKNIDIEEEPAYFANNQWDPKFMSYRQLKKYLEVFNIASPETVRRLLVDLNYKLAFPFTALITVLMGVPFSIETGRASPLIGMVRGIAIAMLYLPVAAISLALGKGGTLPPVAAAWLSNVCFAVCGAYFVNKKS